MAYNRRVIAVRHSRSALPSKPILLGRRRAGERPGRARAPSSLILRSENDEGLQALYAEEHLEANSLQEDAELLLPAQELDEVIRYETHLEDQIERKLRQFYARRRESSLRQADSLPAAGEETLARPIAAVEA